jgi:hypothetical protein
LLVPSGPRDLSVSRILVVLSVLTSFPYAGANKETYCFAKGDSIKQLNTFQKEFRCARK